MTDFEDYPSLKQYAMPMYAGARDIIGRKKEVQRILAAMERPELCNALLLGAAGSGKTALVQATMLQDVNRRYFEVDLAKMFASTVKTDELGSTLKEFFDAAEKYVEDTSEQLVFFMDEFHLITQLSAAAVEALKPILAASGARGIRIIGATTYEEYNQHIAGNLPLVERLQRIRLEAPSHETVIAILRGMAERYDVGHLFPGNQLFEMIYEYTERFQPQSAQPRKSILVLDSMVGFYRASHATNPDITMNRALLADVLKDTLGVNIAFRVDATKIKQKMDEKVFDQPYATDMLARRLQICVADLHDQDKPMSSFLMVGSTGTGKTELTKQLAKLLFGADGLAHLVRFDMSEYSQNASEREFREQLTAKVSSQGHAVILLDEIEKAARTVTRILLQVLDDGKLTDEHGREVSLKNTYIVMTTNEGAAGFENIADYGANVLDFEKKIRSDLIGDKSTAGTSMFPPELLGRIDTMIPFQPLSRETLTKITRRKLADMARNVKMKHGVNVTMTSRVLQFLIEDKAETGTAEGGARRMVNTLTTHVTAAVAAYVNAHPHDLDIGVDIEGEMVSENKHKRISDAHVVVRPAQRGGYIS